MIISTQDNRSLINSDYVSRMYIEETENGAVLVAVTEGEDILLGTYENPEHAESALKFIGICMVDEDAQKKITQVPSRDDMTLKDEVFSGSCPAEALEKLMERIVGKGGATEKPLPITSIARYLTC
jgi:hypothetical protein